MDISSVAKPPKFKAGDRVRLTRAVKQHMLNWIGTVRDSEPVVPGYATVEFRLRESERMVYEVSEDGLALVGEEGAAASCAICAATRQETHALRSANKNQSDNLVRLKERAGAAERRADEAAGRAEAAEAKLHAANERVVNLEKDAQQLHDRNQLLAKLVAALERNAELEAMGAMRMDDYRAGRMQEDGHG